LSKLNFFKKNKFLYWIYKIQKIYKNKIPNSHYAEFAEDVMVNRIFKNLKTGFYLDIGAYHPFKGSLTHNLYAKGWSGMNFDLSKTSIDLFDIARSRDININCAISDFTGETFYYENSSINQQNSLINQNPNQKKIKIKSYQLNEILILNNVNNIDYINIDTEGNELKVLKGIDFKKINPYLFTIEDNSFDSNDEIKKEKINFMEQKNYQLINIIGVTMFFVKKNSVIEISDLIKI
jgi:FkbM family methyltransferase